jgi:preprotein translocase subunit SecF
MLFWHHIPWGVDFRGGTLVYVKFSHAPDDNAIRSLTGPRGLRDARRFSLMIGPLLTTKC